MKQPTEPIEEKWNAYSHAFGVFLGILGTYILVSTQKDANQLLPILIYCVSVVLLFFASTAYHAVKNPLLKQKLRVFDHIGIYYLIAGTYTPVCLWVLQDSKGILLLYLVWGIALFGTVLKLFFTGRFETFSLLLYGIMGWLVVIDLPYLIRALPATELSLLGLGGAFYTLGILFYTIRRIPYNHLIWHFFVLGGAISHFYMIFLLLKHSKTPI